MIASNKNPPKKTEAIWLLMVGVLIVSVGLNLVFGSSDVNGLIVLLNSLGQSDGSTSESLAHSIIYQIRFPRIIIAALAGSGLAAAGVLTQGLFRNPLASPSVLGAAAGASSFAAVGFYLGIANQSIYTTPLLGMLGAAAVCSIILTLAKRRPFQSTYSLLLIGFALNALFSAFTSLIISLLLSEHLQSSAIVYWLMGSFTGKSWEQVPILLFTSIVGISIAVRLTKQLDLIALGEDTAASLGVNLKRFRTHLIAVVAILVGGSISISGGIPFVGLIVPHISRQLVGPKQPRVLAASCINGASLTLLADLAARMMLSPQEINVGVLISLIGALFFVYLIANQKGRDTLG